MKKYILSILVITGFILGSVSCTEDWKEMNQNPNVPGKAPTTNILSNTLVDFSNNFYDDWQDMNNFMSYAGHVTKIQYVDAARYEYRESVVNSSWTDYYNLLMDLKKMKKIAKEEGKRKTWAVAETFSVFLWHFMTDMWKSIPYSEALKAEEGTNNPAYDSQQAIYNDLFTRLEEANKRFNEPVNQANPEKLGSGDLIYDGSFAKWQKFCNSLRLRFAMRISEVSPDKAKSQAETILSNSSQYPIFNSGSDRAFLQWSGSKPHQEPWYEISLSRDDHGMAETLVDTLKALNDPRLPIYADTISGGRYVGLVEGAAKGSFSTDTISRLGDIYRDDPAGFSPFMRYSETMFNVAEAAVKGWNTGGISAQEAYEAGIEASMQQNWEGVVSYYGGKGNVPPKSVISEGDINNYMSQSRVAWDPNNTPQEKLHKIYKQKWISLFKQGREAWTLSRRTDFPAIDAAPGSPFPGHNRQPFRYPYPTQEKNLNSQNISKVLEGIEDHYWGQQMWWDTRDGVE